MRITGRRMVSAVRSASWVPPVVRAGSWMATIAELSRIIKASNDGTFNYGDRAWDKVVGIGVSCTLTP